MRKNQIVHLFEQMESTEKEDTIRELFDIIPDTNFYRALKEYCDDNPAERDEIIAQLDS